MEIPITEIVTNEYQISWLPWAVQYFTLIGMSYSAVLLTLPGFVFHKPDYKSLAHVALFVAVITTIVAPVSLLADLHQPARFWHFYVYLSPWSWMWIGAMILPLYVFSVLVYAWLVYRPELIQRGQQEKGIVAAIARYSALGRWQKPELIKVLGICSAILGMFIALYTGAEVMIVKARPLWHTYALPVMFMITAMGGAAGLAHLINRLHFNNTTDVARQLNQILIAVSLFSIIVGVLWLITGAMGYSSSAAKALYLLQSDRQWQITLIIESFAVLLVLFVANLNNVNKYFNNAWLIGFIAIYSAWMFRWMVFIDVQRIPRYGAGTYSYGIPLGHEGIVGILGTLGLLVFVFVCLTTLLPEKK
jgi:tetrathionate reductase subunit C